MKGKIFLGVIALLVAPALGLSQSLGEVAQKEKERRKQNKDRGRSVRVLTEADLARAEGESAPPEQAPSSSGRFVEESSAAQVSSGQGDQGVEQDVEPVIPVDGTPQEKLAAFQALKKRYEKKLAEMDKELLQNQTRLAEIEQKLSSLGAGGLPVAPQVDQAPRYDGEFFGLMDEKGKLLSKNEELERRKQALREELAAKGRRAGVPPGYLRQ